MHEMVFGISLERDILDSHVFIMRILGNSPVVAVRSGRCLVLEIHFVHYRLYKGDNVSADALNLMIVIDLHSCIHKIGHSCKFGCRDIAALELLLDKCRVVIDCRQTHPLAFSKSCRGSHLHGERPFCGICSHIGQSGESAVVLDFYHSRGTVEDRFAGRLVGVLHYEFGLVPSGPLEHEIA